MYRVNEVLEFLRGCFMSVKKGKLSEFGQTLPGPFRLMRAAS